MVVCVGNLMAKSKDLSMQSGLRGGGHSKDFGSTCKLAYKNVKTFKKREEGEGEGGGSGSERGCFFRFFRR